MITQTFNLSSQLDSGGKALIDSVQVSGNQAIAISPTSVPSGTVNLPYAIAFDVTKVQGIELRSNCNLTITTNNAGTPADTINLLAGIPYLWFVSGYFANLFRTSVTEFFLSNSSGQGALLQGQLVTL